MAQQDGARHALVLGSGGVAGTAWETGLLAGAAEAGVDLADADVVLGTSAGSTVAAQITGTVPLADLYRAQVEGTGAPEPVIDVDLAALMTEIQAAAEYEPDPESALRAIGRIALEQDRVPQRERRRLIEARLADRVWPERTALLVAAVSATSGRLRVFDRDAGVDLVDAVAASCAIPRVWPAVTIGDDRYMDGGTRSATNEDALAGFAPAVTVVLDVLALDEGVHVDRDAGRTRALIAPDARSRAALADLLDPGARRAAAEAGRDQGLAIAAQLPELR